MGFQHLNQDSKLLWFELRKRLLKWLRRRYPRVALEDAEDIVEEALVRFFDSRRELLSRRAGECSEAEKTEFLRKLRQWCWTYTRRLLRRHAREDQLQVPVVGGGTEVEGGTGEDRVAETGEPPDPRPEPREMYADLQRAVERLSTGEREVVEKVLLQQHSFKEVARQLDISLWAVYKRWERARQRLQHELREWRPAKNKRG
jgi:RNA polymerase sigma factor (sigma-70 family)